MEFLELIKSRHATRGFLSKPVADEDIERILDAARFAPSGVNTQPWKVAILKQNAREKLYSAIIESKASGAKPNPDYDYYPANWVEPFKSRRKSCGMALYQALEISREDTEKLVAAWNRNYAFFEAPVGLMFFIDKQLSKGSWLDLGMFIQNIMLAAQSIGLATCPQAAFADYPDIVRDILEVEAGYAVVCGMAMGYEDPRHPANQYRLEREPVKSFTSWYD